MLKYEQIVAPCQLFYLDTCIKRNGTTITFYIKDCKVASTKAKYIKAKYKVEDVQPRNHSRPIQNVLVYVMGKR